MTLFGLWVAIPFTINFLLALARAFKPIKKKRSILMLCVLLQPFHAPIAAANTFVYPNGTTMVLSDSDLVLKSNKQVRIDDIVMSGHTLSTRDGQCLALSGSYVALECGQLQFNSAFSNITVVGPLRLDTQGGGDITLAAGSERRVLIDAASLVLVGAQLNLTGSDVTCQVLRVDQIEVDGSTVRAVVGDLTLKGQTVRVDDTLAVDTINSTTINANILLSPLGLGSVKVAEGKTLDLTGVSLLLDDDAIRGDKVDGGFIHNITIVVLSAGKIETSLITNADDIQLTPGTGHKTRVLAPLEVQNIHLETNTISTTTDNLELGSNTNVASGKTLDMTGATMTIGPNTLADNAISGDKVEGGTIDAITINKLQVNGTVQVEDGVLAKGGVRDSHAWASQSARRAQLALGINNGGFGSSVFTGGPMNASFFSGYDAINTSSSSMKGFWGAIFDGRFVYFVPFVNSRVLRYDTQGDFQSPDSWIGFSPGSEKKFHGAIFDGRCLYLVPSLVNGTVTRYDTTRPFDQASSWSKFVMDHVCHGGSPMFYGGVFDGRHIILAPGGFSATQDSHVIRYDTWSPFDVLTSWDCYDAKNVGPGSMGGFFGAVFTGQFTYFVPFEDTDGGNSGKVLRLDSQGNFHSPSSWAGYDAKDTSPGTMEKFHFGVFDGRYVYMMTKFGLVLRHDTAGNFTEASSWSGYDPTSTPPGSMTSFRSGAYDGRHAYFLPGMDSGKVLRYDTHGIFFQAASWTGIDASATSPGVMVGYRGATFDGRYLYLVPGEASEESHGRVLRYDTRAPIQRPSIQQIASNSDLFIDSDGKVGIGYRLEVKGTTNTGTDITIKGDGPDIGIGFHNTGTGGAHWSIISSSGVSGVGQGKMYAWSDTIGTGWVLDGTNMALGSANSHGKKLHVTGDAYVTGTLTASTVTATTCCDSDIRLKKDVTSLSGALETIKKMRGIRYKWKSNGEPSIGFVAQELESVVPEVVVTGSDGYKAVDYGKLSAVLAVAVQEMEEKHNKMEHQQKESNDKIDALIQVCHQ